MDVHENLPEGAGAKDVAEAHRADVQTQEKYGVNHKKYQGTRRTRRCSAWWRPPSITVHR